MSHHTRSGAGCRHGGGPGAGDFGNGADRKVARLKYLVADWGIQRFKAKLMQYYGSTLSSATAEDIRGIKDHLGWGEQGDGRWYYGLNVETGEFVDNEECS